MIENQVCSLEFSKKLRNLGVKQDSLFYWVRAGLNVITSEENWHIEILQHNLSKIPEYYISAFTVADLGEIFPSFFKIGKMVWKLFLDKSMKNNVYIVQYYEQKKKGRKIHFYDKNEANARAKMLIHLIENKFLEVK